jgi:hypothetical protein
VTDDIDWARAQLVTIESLQQELAYQLLLRKRDREELAEKQEALELYVGEMQRLRRELHGDMSREDRVGQMANKDGELRIVRGQLAAARVKLARTETALGIVVEDADNLRGRLDKVLDICLNPPVPSRMLIPYIRDAATGDAE